MRWNGIIGIYIFYMISIYQYIYISMIYQWYLKMFVYWNILDTFGLWLNYDWTMQFNMLGVIFDIDTCCIMSNMSRRLGAEVHGQHLYFSQTNASGRSQDSRWCRDMQRSAADGADVSFFWKKVPCKHGNAAVSRWSRLFGAASGRMTWNILKPNLHGICTAFAPSL